MIVSILLWGAALAAANSDASPTWQLEAGPLVTSAVASRGRSAVGGMLVVSLAPMDGPLLVGIRAHWSFTDANDSRVRLEHQRVGAEVLVGTFLRLGIGRMWATAYGGPRWIHEHAAPHRAKRLQAAGLGQSVESDLVFPAFGLEVGMGLSLIKGFGLAVAAAPELLVFKTTDGSSLEGRPGLMARGAVTYAF